jgi:hypothetical protein
MERRHAEKRKQHRRLDEPHPLRVRDYADLKADLEELRRAIEATLKEYREHPHPTEST